MRSRQAASHNRAFPKSLSQWPEYPSNRTHSAAGSTVRLRASSRNGQHVAFPPYSDHLWSIDSPDCELSIGVQRLWRVTADSGRAEDAPRSV